MPVPPMSPSLPQGAFEQQAAAFSQAQAHSLMKLFPGSMSAVTPAVSSRWNLVPVMVPQF